MHAWWPAEGFLVAPGPGLTQGQLVRAVSQHREVFGVCLPTTVHLHAPAALARCGIESQMILGVRAVCFGLGQTRLGGLHCFVLPEMLI